MDHRKFMKHFLGCQDLVKGYLMAALRNWNEVEELFQEVSVVLWEKFSQYDERRPFPAWALGVARLEVLKWRQRRGRSREVLSDASLDYLTHSATECSDELTARHESLRLCLEKIGTRGRAVIELRYEDRLPVQRIAERLKRTVGAIEMTLLRLRRALRSCVESQLH